MPSKPSHSIASLKLALESARDLDALALVAEFREFCHKKCASGSYAALRYDPASGETRFCNEPSWSCSANEYFSESGILSDMTLLSARLPCCGAPGPDDGFEWVDGDDYGHPSNQPESWWEAHLFNQAAEKALDKMPGATRILKFDHPDSGIVFGRDEDTGEIDPDDYTVSDAKTVLAALGWEFFSVGNEPVNGWVPDGWSDDDVVELDNKIAALISAIDNELIDAMAEEIQPK